MTSAIGTGQICPHCGMAHQTTCPRIRAIEYHENGTLKRVEFHEPPIFPAIRSKLPTEGGGNG